MNFADKQIFGSSMRYCSSLSNVPLLRSISFMIRYFQFAPSMHSAFSTFLNSVRVDCNRELNRCIIYCITLVCEWIQKNLFSYQSLLPVEPIIQGRL